MKRTFLGMATQATMTATLTYFDIISPTPTQQGIAAILFIIAALVVGKKGN